MVTKGSVDCGEALRVLVEYYRELGGDVTVDGWTCASGPATAPGTTCATADGREIQVRLS